MFFTHSLFYKVQEYAAEKMRPLIWNVDAHATPLVLMMIASGISERLSNRDIGSPYTDLIWMGLLVPLCFGYRRAQRYINEACGDPEGVSNSELTGANWAWIIVGSIVWLMMVAGLYIMATQAG